MNDKLFLEKGYKEFSPSELDSEAVSKCFQKRFDDEIGKKYFITVKKYDWSAYPEYNIPENYSYEFDTQLYQFETHYPINLIFFSGWNIDSVEKHLENLWNDKDYDYYEKFEDC